MNTLLNADETAADRRLLAQLRRQTGLHHVRHMTGPHAPAWLMVGLEHLGLAELRRVHVWTGTAVGVGGPVTVHVRLAAHRLCVWRIHAGRQQPNPAFVPVRSVRQAVQVLVALEVLHPRWSVAEQLSDINPDDIDACRACEFAGEPCPYHHGQHDGSALLLAAMTLLTHRPILVPGDLGHIVMTELARRGLVDPDGKLLLDLAEHLMADPALMRELAAIAALVVPPAGSERATC